MFGIYIEREVKVKIIHYQCDDLLLKEPPLFRNKDKITNRKKEKMIISQGNHT